MLYIVYRSTCTLRAGESGSPSGGSKSCADV